MTPPPDQRLECLNVTTTFYLSKEPNGEHRVGHYTWCDFYTDDLEPSEEETILAYMRHSYANPKEMVPDALTAILCRQARALKAQKS